MNRRILLVVDVNDGMPGAMLTILGAIAGQLEKLKAEDHLKTYGIDLLTDESLYGVWHKVPIETLEEAEK